MTGSEILNGTLPYPENIGCGYEAHSTKHQVHNPVSATAKAIIPGKRISAILRKVDYDLRNFTFLPLVKMLLSLLMLVLPMERT